MQFQLPVYRFGSSIGFPRGDYCESLDGQLVPKKDALKEFSTVS